MIETKLGLHVTSNVSIIVNSMNYEITLKYKKDNHIYEEIILVPVTSNAYSKLSELIGALVIFYNIKLKSR